MNSRTFLASTGAGLVAFLLTTVLVIELLAIEFSAIVGLPVGAIVGLGVFVLLLARYVTLSHWIRTAVDAVAGFGLGSVLLLAGNYVHLLDVSLEGLVAGAIVTGVVAGLWSWLDARSRSTG